MKYSTRNLLFLFNFFFFALFFVPPVHATVDNTGSGILHMRAQAPMQSLRMVMPLVSAGSVNLGWGFFGATTWTNVWAEEQEYNLDYEMLETRVSMNYGFNDKFGIMIGYDNRNYFGGEMDGLIQGFHDLIGGQNGRDKVPKGLSRVGRIGDTVEESKADIFNNNGISLSLSYDLTDGDEHWPAVNVTTSVRYGIETGEVFSDNHPVDYGFSLGVGKRWLDKWYSHAIVSYTFYDFDQSRGLTGFVPVSLVDLQFGGLLSVGYNYSEKLVILAQYSIYEAAVNNISGLDKSSHEAHLGIKYRTENTGLIEFGVIENMVNYDNSPDFGFHLGWEYEF